MRLAGIGFGVRFGFNAAERHSLAYRRVYRKSPGGWMTAPPLKA
jgi:hypothetical protein